MSRRPVYAAKRAMWLVIVDVLRKAAFTSMMPQTEEGGKSVVDADAAADDVEDVYQWMRHETGTCPHDAWGQVIKETIEQCVEKKMVPKPGEPWTTRR